MSHSSSKRRRNIKLRVLKPSTYLDGYPNVTRAFIANISNFGLGSALNGTQVAVYPLEPNTCGLIPAPEQRTRRTYRICRAPAKLKLKIRARQEGPARRATKWRTSILNRPHHRAAERLQLGTIGLGWGSSAITSNTSTLIDQNGQGASDHTMRDTNESPRSPQGIATHASPNARIPGHALNGLDKPALPEASCNEIHAPLLRASAPKPRAGQANTGK